MGASSNDNQAGSGSHRAAFVGPLDNVRARIGETAEAARANGGRSALTDPLGHLHNKLVKISNLRSRRRDLFGDDLFGEPAWDILLSLLQSSLTDRVESVGSACLAAGVPQSTALRWLNLLESRGWVERRSDCEDGRRVHVRLTDKARSTLLELLSDTGG